MTPPRLKDETLQKIVDDPTLGWYSTGMRVWPSVSFLLKGMASELTERRTQEAAEPSKSLNPTPGPSRPTKALSRRTDPWTAKEGAERIEPKRETRKAEVLDKLRAHEGVWVSGSLLATMSCGGSEGLRRLRELRADNGWPIERRRDPESETMFEYRLPKEEAAL